MPASALPGNTLTALMAKPAPATQPGIAPSSPEMVRAAVRGGTDVAPVEYARNPASSASSISGSESTAATSRRLRNSIACGIIAIRGGVLCAVSVKPSGASRGVWEVMQTGKVTRLLLAAGVLVAAATALPLPARAEPARPAPDRSLSFLSTGPAG